MNSPTPFCYNYKRIKAIVLGADPSNFSDKGKTKYLNKAFGIGDGDARYFQNILTNLKTVGLNLENIYVDNLIQDYQDFETSKHKDWDSKAKGKIFSCMERLDKIDKGRKIPVLITAEVIYKAISKTKPFTAEQFYNLKEVIIPVASSDNELKRPVIPFYRHKNYSLEKWNRYQRKVKKILDSIL